MIEPSSTDEGSDIPVPERDSDTPPVVVRRLFEEHNRRLVRFLLSLLHNEQDAVEVAQEAYVQLLQLQKPGGPNLLTAYLFKIARNIAIDRVRRSKVRADYSQSSPASDVFEIGLEESYLAGEQLRLFWQAVDELPDTCRRALLLSKFNELSTDQIAEQMQVSSRMVRKYIVHSLVYCRLRLAGASSAEARKMAKSNTDE
jgi:RNA polymerase sigma-70 factor (ECF subfamily)